MATPVRTNFLRLAKLLYDFPRLFKNRSSEIYKNNDHTQFLQAAAPYYGLRPQMDFLGAQLYAMQTHGLLTYFRSEVEDFHGGPPMDFFDIKIKAKGYKFMRLLFDLKPDAYFDPAAERYKADSTALYRDMIYQCMLSKYGDIYDSRKCWTAKELSDALCISETTVRKAIQQDTALSSSLLEQGVVEEGACGDGAACFRFAHLKIQGDGTFEGFHPLEEGFEKLNLQRILRDNSEGHTLDELVESFKQLTEEYDVTGFIINRCETLDGIKLQEQGFILTKKVVQAPVKASISDEAPKEIDSQVSVTITPDNLRKLSWLLTNPDIVVGQASQDASKLTLLVNKLLEKGLRPLYNSCRDVLS